MEKIVLTPPLDNEKLKKLKIGDTVYITGTIYTARDAAHKRLVDLLAAGEELPIDLAGQIIYYAGPAPNKPFHRPHHQLSNGCLCSYSDEKKRSQRHDR